MRRKWIEMMGLGLLLACTSVGCMEANECTVTALESGGSEILCPGEGAVTTDEEIPDDARCQTRGDEVVCTTGERFGFPKEESGGGESHDAGDTGDVGSSGEDSPAEPDSPLGAVGGSAGPWEANCQRVGDEVLCSDGAKAAVGELPAGAECVSTMVPGVGRRIVCDGEKEFSPDAGSVPGIEVTCTKHEVEPGRWDIECSDGTGLLLDEGVELDAECVPEATRSGNEVVVSCGEQEWRIALSAECTGTFYIENEADQAELSSRKCQRWWGDLIIKASDLDRINKLGALERISGSLEIVDNESLTRFEFFNLWAIGGDLVVRNNPRLTKIEGWRLLAWVGGSVEYSANERVDVITPHPSYWIGGSWSITGHERLRIIGLWHIGDLYWSFVLPTAHVEGAFLFFDNTAFGFCKTELLWIWAVDHAEVVYLGNSGKRVRSSEWCTQWREGLGG